jgi:small subunit ribosomal protein S20
MANHKSALKKAKQDIGRRLRNRSGKSRLRTALKKFRLELAEGSEGCRENLPGMLSLIDKSAKHGFIHQNAADRLKSKLSRQTLTPAS